jgi:hypothetical protein
MGFNMDNEKGHGIRENSTLIRLFLYNGRASAEENLENRLRNKTEPDERIEDRRNEVEFQQGYDSVMARYLPYIQDTKAKDIDYKKIWNSAPEEFGLKVTITYIQEVKKWLGLKKVYEDRTETKGISPKSLEEIAKLREEEVLKRSNLGSMKRSGQYVALIDLSLKALRDPKITAEDGAFLIRNLYLALYITKDKVPEALYKKFLAIRLYNKKDHDFLRCPETIKQKIAAAFNGVWIKHQMDVLKDRKKYRSSKEIEKELLQREVKEELDREEDTDQEMKFPEAW